MVSTRYRAFIDDKAGSPDAILPAIYAKSRDKGRTPVQWDASENAGFTSGTPWIKVILAENS